MRQWLQLGALDPNSLAHAREQCHHAVLLLTHVARGYVAARDDDSHTNLGWDPVSNALVGHTVESGNRPFTLALAIPDLTLLCLDAVGGAEAAYPLDKRTWDDAAAWIREILTFRHLDAAPFDRPLHFRIAPHPIAEGAAFDAAADREALAELARYYGNGDLALREATATEPRVWPHHFDLGTLTSDGTIGLGLSPGDDSYNQPYFYVNKYPAPDTLPPLTAGGHWHTDNWTGAVLTAEDILQNQTAEAQQGAAKGFLKAVLDSLA